MKSIALSFVAFMILLSACQEQAPKEETTQESTVVEFKGRQIDLKPYFEGFPYLGFMPFYKAGELFYFKEDSTRMLMSLDMASEMNLENGTVVSDVDFSKRNTWGIKYNSEDGCLYWNGDEVNDEVMNLYKLDPKTQEVTKLTDVPYIFSWGWNDDKSKIAYVARLGTKENRLAELRVLDLKSGEETKIIQDVPEMRFTWGGCSWGPNSKYVVTPAYTTADRNYGNLMLVDIEEKTWKLLTDSSKSKRGVDAYGKWLSDSEFIYTSNEDGYLNIYKYDISSDTKTQITTFELDLQSYDMVEIDEEKFIFAITGSPIDLNMYLVSTDGEIINKMPTDLKYEILDSDGNKVIANASNHSSKFQLDEITVTKEDFSINTILDIPDELKSKIYHANVEAIEYPTFDIDPATGEQRMIHAFLYKPENPLPEGERLVMIQSFYGGYNDYHPRTQMLSEAGIYVLSPAPRGSSLFGKDFAGLNDKDLGGNEIVDIIYAAKWCEEELGIPNTRIGVYGGSHGGYATMRLLTFPGEINGVEEDYDFGFGLSHAGFSDIIHFYETCNIPDWVILEAGDPATEADKLNDRSPLYHADKMVGKLLLTHGTNDSRVPIEGSRWMADSLSKYNKSYELVEFEGQGHSIKGLKNNIDYYSTWFEFLETIK